jgi:hypothetical protein
VTDGEQSPPRRHVRGRPFTKGNPGKPKGAVAKVPAEIRQAFRDFYDRPETRDLLFKRIEMDLKSSRHPGTFALEILAQAIGKPPVDLNLNAGNSLRDALLAAFVRETPAAGEDPT